MTSRSRTGADAGGSRVDRILLVTGRQELAGQIRLALTHGGLTTRTAARGSQAMTIFEQWRPHLVVVEMEMEDGRSMAKFSADSSLAGHTPVIALTRRGDLETKLLAWDLGVDDILTVPFSPDELLARAVVVLRRNHQIDIELSPAIQVGELEINVMKRVVSIGGHQIHLTSLEEAILYLLAGNPGRVLTRNEIRDAVWGEEHVAGSNVVDKHIRALRVKLQNSSRKPRYIVTVPRKGYCFMAVSSGAPEAQSRSTTRHGQLTSSVSTPHRDTKTSWPDAR